MAIDSNYNSVVLLLHAEDGVLTDSSATPKTVTANGNAALSTAQAKFGSSSVAFDGTGDYLSTPNSVDFDFGAGDLTIEAWVYIAGNSSPDAGGERGVNICSTWNAIGTASISGWALTVLGSTTTTGTGLAFSSWNAGAATIYTSTVSVSQSQWHHVAATVTSGVRKLFLDGVLVSGTTTTVGAGYTTPNSLSSPLRVGMTANTIYPVALNGYIDGLRITKGVARYTADFTPSTEPFPNADHETGTVTATLPKLQSGAFGGAAIFLPSLMSYAGIVTSANSVLMTLPSLSAVAYSGASGGIQIPSLSVYSQGHDSTGEQALDLTLPSLTATAQGGANAKLSLPSLSGQAAGTVTSSAKASISLPSLSATANATASEVGSANITLPSMSGKIYAGALCSITIGKLTAQATGTTGSIGGAQITLPLFQATAIATAGNHGYANIVLPSLNMHSGGNSAAVNLPSLTLTAIGSAVITATYEAYAVNLGHRNPQATTNEVTRYTNFPFTHVVRYQNSYYGASSTGLYLLEGTTDDATPIPWSFKTGITDFDDAKQKTVAAAYFGGSMPPATTVTLFEGDKVGVPYAQTTPRGADLQNYRETFARGVKGRYYALGLSGTGNIELDDLDFEIKQLTRRI